MRIGDLRYRVTIQQRVTGEDEYGQPVETWQDVVTVWAKVEDLTGREYFVAQQVPTAQVSTHITIRWRAGIKPEMRAMCKDRVFNIVAVLDPDGRRRWLYLMAQEVIP